jgi:two-component system, OmpR family, sensor histidine kinase CpxA
MTKKTLAIAILNIALSVVLLLWLAGPELRQADGQRWLELTVGLIAISLICWLPFVRSVSRTLSRLGHITKKIADGQLGVKAPEHGDDELRALGQSINSMASRFEQMMSSQKRFLGDVAHELSAPIARVQFALGVLEETVEDTRQGDLKALHDEILEMSALVSELLAFSRAGLDAGVAPLTAVNLLQAAQRAADRENVPALLTIDPGLTAMAHEVYLSRALSNLLRNAMRYAGDAGPIEVRTHRQGVFVEVVVGDCGPGLPESELELIFQPFYRMDTSRTSSTGGKGLGLAIVKSCIEVCRGEVFCRNRSPRGLDVVIRLNTAPVQAN